MIEAPSRLTLGRKSDLVTTTTIGFDPIASRSLAKNVPWKSNASTTITTSAFSSRRAERCARSCSAVTRPGRRPSVPWPAGRRKRKRERERARAKTQHTE